MDIGGWYRVLGAEAGFSQRQIAARVGQSQSEVSEIVAGRRRVESHEVLVRIAAGFEIPRELMGLSWRGPQGTYCGEDPIAEPSTEEGEDVRRRALLAGTSWAALGQVVLGVGELAELALPSARELPARLSMAHVHAGAAVTGRLREVARQFGGQAELFVAAVQCYTPWMKIPATEVVKELLGAVLAELCTEVGWSCYDSGLDGAGCFTRALHLADEAGDALGIANAAWHSGLTRASAVAYALMDHPNQAKRCLAEAREGWEPRDTFEQGEADLVTAGILIDLHQSNTAEQFAASAVRAYGERHRRGRTQAELMHAEVHVRAGEPRGLILARQAIEAVSTLQSVSARQQRLVPKDRLDHVHVHSGSHPTNASASVTAAKRSISRHSQREDAQAACS